MGECVVDVMSGRLSHWKDRTCLNSLNTQDLTPQGDEEVRHEGYANKVDNAREYWENGCENEEDFRHEERRNRSTCRKNIRTWFGDFDVRAS